MPTQPKTLNIHPELQGFIPPLSDDERRQLTIHLLAEGCRDPIDIWLEENVILDGHHRYAICQACDIPFTIRRQCLPDLEAAKLWIIDHQLGRRNSTPDQKSYLRGKQRELVGHQNHRPDKKVAQNELLKTDEQLAAEHKVSVATIKRDADFAKNVDAVSAVVPEAKQTILARDAKLTRKNVKALTDLAKDSPQTLENVLGEVTKAKTRKAAQQVMRDATKAMPQPQPEAPKAQDIPLQLVEETSEQPEGTLEKVPTSGRRPIYILRKPGVRAVFNRAHDMVDWAKFTWDPVTGCMQGCKWCYARGIAHDSRMAKDYPKQFAPTFHPYRLDAPANTPFPKDLTGPADRRVLVCSMADLFGPWVPDEWIMDVFERVTRHPEWSFLFLTQFPLRLQDVCDALDGFPENAWMGCTVDTQARVATAERVFSNLTASIRWLSVEPMLERLTLTSTFLDRLDWLVMGGLSASAFNGTPAKQPAWEWVEHLWRQARAVNLKVYWQENLTVRPKEMPG